MTGRALYMLLIGLPLVYVALLTLLVIFQRSFIYFPNTSKPTFAEYGQPAQGYKVVKTKTDDGLTLEGWHYKGEDNAPVVLWFHGNGSHYANRVYWAQYLTAAGYNVVLASYRGYGGNPGQYTEANIMKDAHAWVKTVKDDLQMPTDNIILYGESLGTGVAIEMANHYEFKAMILHTPYKSLRALAEKDFPIFPIRYVMYDQYDSLARISDIKKMPVLMFHGTRDEIIPYAHAKELFDAAPEPKMFVALDGASHSDIFSFGAEKAIFDFLEKIENTAMQK